VQSAYDPSPTREDGFGTPRIEQAPTHGRVERLTLAMPLARAGPEQAIRARAAHLTKLGRVPIARVVQIAR
jgi:hypothetical protein